ncbi:hypothetical protein FOXG_20598 [Fusarium oxysporum f. sp. lycopersici 4287]|uniref:Uncharacterized protein n=2 Tax=Fusarium oxysporum TaxID=5507 RepID=A0A0J9VLA6_FUSO4|nr:hypothetical protein FOXG_20598 [Fusarium oxysporum f. sp. lycopersici 4287]EXK29808.1 hypothetical protein FOMG_14237 [Fusarium oxysporum f. sp. melonis 26406]KNB11994.1 hypothetical protein FOXG_20598 [Fusarium oxysporum f. sp. lycopersici 4287]
MVDRGGCTRNIRLSQVGLSSGCRVEDREGRKKEKKTTRKKNNKGRERSTTSRIKSKLGWVIIWWSRKWKLVDEEKRKTKWERGQGQARGYTEAKTGTVGQSISLRARDSYCSPIV